MVSLFETISDNYKINSFGHCKLSNNHEFMNKKVFSILVMKTNIWHVVYVCAEGITENGHWGVYYVLVNRNLSIEYWPLSTFTFTKCFFFFFSHFIRLTCYSMEHPK